MSRLVSIIRRTLLDGVFKDASAVRSLEAVVNYCINAIPEALQYETPADGGTITVQSIRAGEWYNIWLVMHAPAGHVTGLTIVFPVGAGINAPLTGQELTITAEHNITGLTLNANGAIIVNGVTSISAGTSVKFKFLGGKWYRIY